MKQANIIAILTLILAYYGSALPIESTTLEQDPELYGNFFEGDMDIDLLRNGLRDTSKRWPNATVYYKLDNVFNADQVSHIHQAMRNIESVSCVRFLPVSANISAYVNITGNPFGCYSNVGYRGRIQTINFQQFDINQGCFIIGKLMHELLHTLGFIHQHSTPNRDGFVRIVEANIIEGKERAFTKQDVSQIEDFGVEYDYASVMHYPRKAFSKNGLDTVVPLQDVEIGQRRQLSENDIFKLNQMYNCSEN